MDRTNPVRIKHEVDNDEEQKDFSINNAQQQLSVQGCTKVKKGEKGGEIKLELDDDDYLECTVEGFIKIELNQTILTDIEGANPIGPSNSNEGVLPQQCKLAKKEEQHDENDLDMNIKNDANQCSDEYRFVTLLKFQNKENEIDVVLIWNGLFYYMPKSMYKSKDYNKKRELWVKKEELDEILSASELRYTFSAHIVKILEEEERRGQEKGFYLRLDSDLKWNYKMKKFILKSNP